MDLRQFFETNKQVITTLLLSIIIISIIGAISLPGLLSPVKDTRFYLNPSSSFPTSFNKSKFHNFEQENLQEDISTAIWGYTEFRFFDDFSGGMTGSRMVIYNNFSHRDNDVAIIHHFYIIARYEYQLIKQNKAGEWVASAVHYSWGHPNDSMLFSGVDDNFDTPIVNGDLIFGDTINGSGYSWLDLGEIKIGGSSRSVEGFNVFSINYGSSQASETYHNGENVIYNNFFAVKRLKQFVVRDDISWQVSKNNLFGWQTILNKTYYLGNNALEGSEGLENASGILLTPYVFNS